MTDVSPKITVLKGAEPDLSAATYQIHDESHTIGNALRWMLMKNPKVEFCGYSVPHPSENHIHMRIQMYDNLSSLTALLTALSDLDNLCVTIDDAYHASLQAGQYERWDEKRFSVELLYSIFALLPRESLCNCCLVCRQWVFISRDVLFYCVVLDDSTRFNKLALQIRSLDMLFHIQSIHSLHLGNPLGHHNRDSSFASEFLIHFARNLPMLQQLFLYGTSFDSLDALPDVLPGFVQKLQMTDCVFLTFRDMRRLVCACPRLLHLTLWYISWKDDEKLDDAFWSVLSCELNIVKIHDCSLEFSLPIMDWLRSALIHRSCHQLYIDYIPLSGAGAVGDLLRDLGASVQHLALHFVPTARLNFCTSSNISFSLAHNTALRTLNLGIFHASTLHLMSYLLKQIVSHNMAIIFLQVEMVPDDALRNDHAWEDIVTILSQQQFDKLRIVRFDLLAYFPVSPGKVCCQHVRSKLRGLHTRGILNINCKHQ